MRRECRKRFPRRLIQKKLLVSDLGMYHGTCVRHVPWFMLGSLTRGSGESVSGSRRMRNTQFYVSGKWPMYLVCCICVYIYFWIQSDFQLTTTISMSMCVSACAFAVRCRYFDSPNELLGAVQKEKQNMLQLLQKIYAAIPSTIATTNL